MRRMTRAKAADLAEQMHIDEDALLELPDELTHKQDLVTPEPEDRTPLADIAPNSGSSMQDEEPEADLKKSTRSRKGAKKGPKTSNKKHANDAPSASTPTTPDETVKIVPDEHHSAPSPASEAASDDLMKAEPELEMSHLPVHDIRPNSPPSKAVRLTRSQLRKSPEELESAEPKSPLTGKTDLFAQDAERNDSSESSPDGGAQVPKTTSATVTEPVPHFATDDTTSVSENMPSTRQRGNSPVRLSTPTRNKDVTAAKDQPESMTSDTLDLDASTYDQLEAAAVEAQATPPRSSGKAASEDPIMALDALDEAVDKVNAEVLQVPASPDKPKTKKAPIVRTTKASQARISLAHGPKDPQRRTSSWGKPKPSAAFTQSTTQRVISTSSDKTTRQAPEKKAVEIPHSKPRPISLSFPTPPPPPKSTKAPTKSTFQLPGEAVAAKLKAVREARLQKEAEDQKKKAFKARPAPTATKAPAIRQTSASKARESLINGKPPLFSDVHKRANSVATTRPSMGGKPNIIKSASTSTAKPVSNRLSVAPAPVVKVSKRPSTAMAAMNRPRPATALNRAAPHATIARPASSIGQAKGNGTAKGKAVFNRAAQAKSAAEQEKREKEEAAKKARAEAAERGRQLSREWAEKQRLKKLSLKLDSKPKENVIPVEEVSAAPAIPSES